MARGTTLSSTRCKNALKDAQIVLSSSDSILLERETQRRYAEHLNACRTLGIEPASFKWFCVHIAEQIQRGKYEQPRRLTPINDPGCKKLLLEITVVAKQRQRLRQWHAGYVRACRDLGLVAYTLHLILDAFHYADVQLPKTLLDQARQINLVVSNYVRQTNRKENPTWYVRPLKPSSSKTDKYAD